MGPVDYTLNEDMSRDFRSIQHLVQRYARTITNLEETVNNLLDRVYELEQINDDRIDDEKIKQFYEDKLGL